MHTISCPGSRGRQVRTAKRRRAAVAATAIAPAAPRRLRRLLAHEHHLGQDPGFPERRSGRGQVLQCMREHGLPNFPDPKISSSPGHASVGIEVVGPDGGTPHSRSLRPPVTRSCRAPPRATSHRRPPSTTSTSRTSCPSLAAWQPWRRHLADPDPQGRLFRRRCRRPASICTLPPSWRRRWRDPRLPWRRDAPRRQPGREREPVTRRRGGAACDRRRGVGGCGAHRPLGVWNAPRGGPPIRRAAPRSPSSAATSSSPTPKSGTLGYADPETVYDRLGRHDHRGFPRSAGDRPRRLAVRSLWRPGRPFRGRHAVLPRTCSRPSATAPTYSSSTATSSTWPSIRRVGSRSMTIGSPGPPTPCGAGRPRAGYRRPASSRSAGIVFLPGAQIVTAVDPQLGSDAALSSPSPPRSRRRPSPGRRRGAPARPGRTAPSSSTSRPPPRARAPAAQPAPGGGPGTSDYGGAPGAPGAGGASSKPWRLPGRGQRLAGPARGGAPPAASSSPSVAALERPRGPTHSS